MKNYLGLLKNIMENGCDREGRNGKTRALFAQQLRWNLQNGFPIVTTKKVNFRAITGELIWFLSGSTDDEDLRHIMGYTEEKPTIWTANAQDPKWLARAKAWGYPVGSLGRIYGKQWRSWRGTDIDGNTLVVDQIETLIESIRGNPNARRFIVTAWNPADLDEMALSACHVMFQCFCGDDGSLSLSMIQRSCDMFLGVPYNISSYALLLWLLANVTKRWAKELVITFQDAHIYHEHFEQVKLQLTRDPHVLPTLCARPSITEIRHFKDLDDVYLVNYLHDEPIKAKMIL